MRPYTLNPIISDCFRHAVRYANALHDKESELSKAITELAAYGHLKKLFGPYFLIVRETRTVDLRDGSSARIHKCFLMIDPTTAEPGDWALQGNSGDAGIEEGWVVEQDHVTETADKPVAARNSDRKAEPPASRWVTLGFAGDERPAHGMVVILPNGYRIEVGRELDMRRLQDIVSALEHV